MGRKPTFAGKQKKITQPTTVQRIQEKLDILRDWRREWEAVPLEKRDKKYVARLNRRIMDLRKNLNSAGALYGS